MVLPESKNVYFWDFRFSKYQQGLAFPLFELFLLKYAFSNYLVSPFALQEKNKKLHCNHRQKLCFYFEYHTVKNFAKVSEIFDLIWFIVSIINVYQQKKAGTNVNSSNEIILHDEIFIIIIVTTK